MAGCGLSDTWGMFSMYMGQEMLQGNLSCEEYGKILSAELFS